VVAVVDLVADLGEAFGVYRLGNDEALLDIVTSANIACGFHAGDPRTMDRAVLSCVEGSVAIGAHPGFPDLVGFGRRAMDLSPDEVRTDVLYQVGALNAFARTRGARLQHVAPHGKLGNIVVESEAYADAVVEAVAAFDPSLIVLTYEGALAEAARRRGLRLALAGFADRAYRDDGTLVPRSTPVALVSEPDEVVTRVVRMVAEGLVRTVGGRDIDVRCDTILIHGDTPGSVDLGRRVRVALLEAGVTIRALKEPLSG
jgi:5-oxoprolinase (ATP-hydrolysing) subunit A